MSTEIEAMQQDHSALLARARAFQVQDDAALAEAADIMKGCKAFQKKINEFFDPGIEGAHAQHKLLVAQKKQLSAPVDEAVGLFKAKCIKYQSDRDLALQRAREAQERAAREKAEAERAAEAKRLWAEGKRNEAAAVKAAPLVVAPPPPVVEPPKIAGMSTKTVYSFEIEDKTLVPMAFMMVDAVAVGKIVRQLGLEAGPLLPGIKVFAAKNISIKA